MIIVEGPDGGGKTRLCKHLHQTYGVQYAVHSMVSAEVRNTKAFREPEMVRKRVYGALLMEVTARHPALLHDRLFFSESIYSHILERPPAFNFEEETTISRMMTALKVPVIFCIPPWEEIAKKFVATEQMEGLPGKIDKIYDQYVQMAGFMMRANETSVRRNKQDKVKRMPNYQYNLPPVILYDYTKPKTRDTVEKAVGSYLTHRKRREDTWAS